MGNYPSERNPAQVIAQGPVLGATTADPSAQLTNSSVKFYLDEAGNNLKVKVKYSNGTVKTGTVALV